MKTTPNQTRSYPFDSYPFQTQRVPRAESLSFTLHTARDPLPSFPGLTLVLMVQKCTKICTYTLIASPAEVERSQGGGGGAGDQGGRLETGRDHLSEAKHKGMPPTCLTMAAAKSGVGLGVEESAAGAQAGGRGGRTGALQIANAASKNCDATLMVF